MTYEVPFSSDPEPKVRLSTSDGRLVRVEFGAYSFRPREAVELSALIQRAANYADDLPSLHERHVNLTATCPLCRFEAGAQTDRLDWSDVEDE